MQPNESKTNYLNDLILVIIIIGMASWSWLIPSRKDKRHSGVVLTNSSYANNESV